MKVWPSSQKGRTKLSTFRGVSPCGRCMSLTYLILRYSIFQTGKAIWVEIIGPHKNPLLASRHRKWPYPSHHITYYFTGAEHCNKTFVLSVKSTIPVYLGIVKSKY